MCLFRITAKRIGFAFSLSTLCQAATAGAQAVSVNISRGSISVPESRVKKNGKRITLAYVRLHTTAASDAMPIFYLAGGPGGSRITDLLSETFKQYGRWLEFADIIALDQRGTGASSPSLTCPTSYRIASHTVVTQAAALKSYRAAARSCASFWKAKGIDLKAYNTEESADDVAELASTLGFRQIRLFGASYGSHLGLSILRRHPALVQRAVFGAIEGPDQTIKLPFAADEQLGRIETEMRPDVKANFPTGGFSGFVLSLIVKADASPIQAELSTSERVSITGFDLRLLAANMMSRRTTIETLPSLFLAALRGDYTPLADAIQRHVPQDQISAMGAVMDCASFASPARLRVIAGESTTSLFGTAPDFPLPDWCSAWGIEPLPEAFRTPVTSNVPTLFISGDLDSQTPPSNAAEVRAGFGNGRLFVVHRASHDSSLFLSSDALFQAITTFMREGSANDERFNSPSLEFQVEPEGTR